jgi:hypothetical protein
VTIFTNFLGVIVKESLNIRFLTFSRLYFQVLVHQAISSHPHIVHYMNYSPKFHFGPRLHLCHILVGHFHKFHQSPIIYTQNLDKIYSLPIHFGPISFDRLALILNNLWFVINCFVENETSEMKKYISLIK